MGYEIDLTNFLFGARQRGMGIGGGTECLFVIIPLHRARSCELLFNHG